MTKRERFSHVLPDFIFGGLLFSVFLGTFELFLKLHEIRPEIDPFFSSILGPPWPHHLYVLELLLGLVWLVVRRKALLKNHRLIS